MATEKDLLRLNHELRATIRLAGMEIKKLNFGRSDTPLLRKMRAVLREARVVTREYQQERHGDS